MKRLWWTVLLTALTVLPTVASAQGVNRINIFQIAFGEPNGKEQAFGEPIFLKIDGRTQFPKDFHVRFFRGTASSLMSRPPDKDGCVQYSTIVMGADVKATIRLRSLDNPAYLSPRTVGDGFDAEFYTLVFEAGDQPSNSVIRIHKNYIATYFKYSFSIKLVPPDYWHDPPKEAREQVREVVQQAIETLHQRVVQFTDLSGQGSPCWGVKTVPTLEAAHGRGITGIAELVPCLSESEATARQSRTTRGTSGGLQEGDPLSSSFLRMPERPEDQITNPHDSKLRSLRTAGMQ